MVPDGWKIKTLRSIGNCVSGLTYSPSDVVDENHGVLVLRSSNIQGGKLSFADNVYVDVDIDQDKRVQLNDILVCVRNGSKALIGKSALIKDDRAIGQTHGAFMTVFRSEENSYVFQLFQSEMFHKHVYTDLGATINSINNNNLLNYKFPIPPILELKKIAAILSIWDNAISANEDLLANSRLRKKALMQQLLTGKKRLPGFEREWLSTRLGDECSLVTKGTTPSSMGMGFTEEGVSFLKVESLGGNGEILAKQTAFISHETHESLKRSQLSEADLLISIAGALGRTAIVPLRVLPANTNQALAIVRLSPNSSIDLGFLYHSIRSDRIQKYFSEISSQGAQANLSLQQISNIQVWAPGIEEQKAIAELLSVADEETHALEQRINNLKLQKKALMQQLLTGKKRVKVESVTA